MIRATSTITVERAPSNVATGWVIRLDGELVLNERGFIRRFRRKPGAEQFARAMETRRQRTPART